MTDVSLETGAPIDVAIIGGGPAGLAAATALKAADVARVVVLEREHQAGGIPRHCGHPPFGMREFRRVLKGPEYARRLVARARKAGVEIHTLTTVTGILPGGVLTVSTPDVSTRITPRRVIYATGVRETPRSARLISGARVQGVVNTGALQSMVYLTDQRPVQRPVLRPFLRPVIVGSELVAFSALMTCRHAGIRPVAMIEQGPTATARWPSALLPRLQSVALLTNTRLLEIMGTGVVQGVTVAGPDDQPRRIDCDGVIVTGQFTPEAALARCGHLKIDPATGGPLVDQWGRCSDPSYFATGNLLRAVETAGQSWGEGRQTGQWVAQDLAGSLPRLSSPLSVVVRDPRLKYAMPQRIGLPEADAEAGMEKIQLRVTQHVSGTLVARARGNTIWRQAINTRPERRIAVPIAEIVLHAGVGSVEFVIEGSEN